MVLRGLLARAKIFHVENHNSTFTYLYSCPPLQVLVSQIQCCTCACLVNDQLLLIEHVYAYLCSASRRFLYSCNAAVWLMAYESRSASFSFSRARIESCSGQILDLTEQPPEITYHVYCHYIVMAFTRVQLRGEL